MRFVAALSLSYSFSLSLAAKMHMALLIQIISGARCCTHASMMDVWAQELRGQVCSAQDLRVSQVVLQPVLAATDECEWSVSGRVTTQLLAVAGVEVNCSTQTCRHAVVRRPLSRWLLQPVMCEHRQRCLRYRSWQPLPICKHFRGALMTGPGTPDSDEKRCLIMPDVACP